jgi:hypothetical protein
MTREQSAAHQSYMLHEYPWVRIKDLERQVRRLRLIIAAFFCAGTLSWLVSFL